MNALELKTYWTTNRVDDHVYISGYLIAADYNHVRKHGYTHILKLFPDDITYFGGYCRHPGIEYKVVDMADIPEFPIQKHFKECLQFIQKAIRENGKILVHCHAGVSRASTIVLLHLMVNSGYNLSEAWKKLKLIRSVINPNPGFWNRLVDIDKMSSKYMIVN